MDLAAACEAALADIRARLPLWQVDPDDGRHAIRFPVISAKQRDRTHVTVAGTPLPPGKRWFAVIPATEAEGLSSEDLDSLHSHVVELAVPATECFLCFVDNGGTVSYFHTEAARRVDG